MKLQDISNSSSFEEHPTTLSGIEKPTTTFYKILLYDTMNNLLFDSPIPGQPLVLQNPLEGLTLSNSLTHIRRKDGTVVYAAGITFCDSLSPELYYEILKNHCTDFTIPIIVKLKDVTGLFMESINKSITPPPSKKLRGSQRYLKTSHAEIHNEVFIISPLPTGYSFLLSKVSTVKEFISAPKIIFPLLDNFVNRYESKTA